MCRVLSASYILNKFVLGHAAFFLDVFQKFFYKAMETGTDLVFFLPYEMMLDFAFFLLDI